ncbi:YopX family protein [Brevibacillus laterosporus]|uniref:YopX family protein n=1 Tax=Brevibacillus laterosporus TaxID=1465 RepID=UPI00035E955D|nr:YopX family protein [Brevibacillus laterosporus]ATO50120.1 hypothetical protein BrL25_14155 [Brevibacillus laterosporus DSM 25]MED2005470.1 YopX family protein [Brevibacillus laterosporus]
MREIKFQAYWKEKGIMLGVSSIDFSTYVSDGKSSNLSRFYTLDDFEDESNYLPKGTNFNLYLDEVEMRQYTGLHDKTKWDDLTKLEQQEWLNKGKTQEDWKGKEIYKGDIVQISDHPFYDSITVNGNYEVGYNEQMELCCGSWLLFRVKHYAEVIGNIYENPELL